MSLVSRFGKLNLPIKRRLRICGMMTSQSGLSSDITTTRRGKAFGSCHTAFGAACYLVAVIIFVFHCKHLSQFVLAF
ncbi:hypothetical protein B0E50_12135 [Rhodanobacter sp. C01]|nr:hypothetical protein B0E50_12135 [Rhodanobacter sp. C01]